jgi:AcrR family transcriptional regulator
MHYLMSYILSIDYHIRKYFLILKTTRVIFCGVEGSSENPPLIGHKAGRPRRGSEAERLDALIQAATAVFLKEGYGLASIDKIATAAGISTRTIYERFKNKGDLMAAVITRLVDRDLALIGAPAELDRLAPTDALMQIGHTMMRRFEDPEFGALFRLIAAEAQRFPELTAKMRASGKARVHATLAAYFVRQRDCGGLALPEPAHAAELFLQMLTGEVKECLLFECPRAVAALDHETHLARVVQLFLLGATPRPDRPANGNHRP